MAKFHINPMTGNAGRCSAVNGRCPFGEADNHFDSIEEARGAYEAVKSGYGFPQTLKKTSLVEDEDVAVEKNSSDFDSVSFDDFTKVGKSVAAGARNLFGFIGGKTYEKTISDAKERAGYASSYYDKKSDYAEISGEKLRANSTPAWGTAPARTRAALSAVQDARPQVDSSRMLAHATPAVDNVDGIRAALRSRGASKSTSTIGDSARRFSW